MAKWISKLFVNCFGIPQRYVLSFMGFTGVVNAYLMRVVLSVAINEMVLSHDVRRDEITQNELTCPGLDITSSPSSHKLQHMYDWSESIQGLVLSSFYWGYIVTHLPGGALAEKFGGKHVLGFGILSTAIFTILTPLVVKLGDWKGLIMLRVLVGFGEGITFPAINVLLSKWTPEAERSTLGTFVYAGTQIGAVLGNSATGLIIGYTKSWESTFYIFGSVAVVWYVFWIILCYSEPRLHPFISDAEKEFLENQLANRTNTNKYVPWAAILTSIPLWALVIAEVGHDWGLFMMITDLPKYMKDVLKFNVEESGLWSSLPYLTMWIFSMVCARLCDCLIKRNHMTITTARKFFAIIASIVPGMFLVLASYMGCNQVLTIALFTIGMGFMGAYYCGIKMNALDLSPNYAGTIMAIVNGSGAVSGIIAPYLVGILTEDQNLSEWRTVYWITFAILGITSVVFLIFGSAKTQWWNSDVVQTTSTPTKQNVLKMHENLY